MSARDPKRNNKADLSLARPQNRNDRVNAERFIRQHKGKVLYCEKLGWLFWDGCRWKSGAYSQAVELAKETGKQLLKEAEALPDFKDAMSFARKSNNRPGLESMIALAASDESILVTMSALDQKPWLLNCPNGTVDLTSGSLRRHDPADLITQLCPTEFDPSAVAPHFDAFITSLFDSTEVIEFLQRWFGYCLTGDVEQRKLVFMIGKGANGKSTLLSVVQAVLGADYAMQSSHDLLSARQNDTHPTAMMDLFLKRLVICSEIGRNARMSEGAVKQLSGGKSWTGRKMRQDNWQFSLTHKFGFETNNMPKFSDDPALWDRIIVVEFSKRFWDADKDKPGPAEFKQDRSLRKKLASEASGVLAWLVQGSQLFHHCGDLRVPDSVCDVTETYRSKSDHFAEFLRECCKFSMDVTVTATALKNAFAEFCRESGYTNDLSPKAMAQRLAKEGFVSFRSNGIRYRGLMLKTTPKSGAKKLKVRRSRPKA